MSSAAVAASLQQSLLMPVLTRMPKQRVKTQVVCLAPGAVPAAVLRQSGVPVHDVALSRKRFSFGGFGELLKTAKAFKPDVIHAWGYTAQIVANAVRKRCDRKIKVVWTVGSTTPLPRGAGMIDRQKVKYAAKAAPTADRIVYASEAGAAQHRRVGFPDGEHLTIPPGIDATRFKPDPAARRKIREQLHLGAEAFVIGMVAPFQPEYDHPTFLKAVGELIKSNPHISVVLAGHGVQKGNAPLMALVGGGTLGARVQLLGEWSDLASLFNACDVVCSSALNDSGRMTLVAAMLCGVPCVATGLGAQGEVIGHHGVAIESGSAPAFVKGIQRVLQLTPEKRAAMAQGARKHALQNYVYVRSLQRYLQLYYDLIGRQSLVSQEMPTPEIDATVPVPAKVGADRRNEEAAGRDGRARRSGLARDEGHGACGRGVAEVAPGAGTGAHAARAGFVAADRRHAIRRRRAAGVRSRAGETDAARSRRSTSARAALRTRAKSCCRWMRSRRRSPVRPHAVAKLPAERAVETWNRPKVEPTKAEPPKSSSRRQPRPSPPRSRSRWRRSHLLESPTASSRCSWDCSATIRRRRRKIRCSSSCCPTITSAPPCRSGFSPTFFLSPPQRRCVARQLLDHLPIPALTRSGGATHEPPTHATFFNAR